MKKQSTNEQIILSKKKIIKEIAQMIEDYVKPLNKNTSCKHCISGLSNMIYDIFEAKRTLKKGGK